MIFNRQKSERFWKNSGIDSLGFDLSGKEENIFVANHSAVDWMFVFLHNSYLEVQSPPTHVMVLKGKTFGRCLGLKSEVFMSKISVLKRQTTWAHSEKVTMSKTGSWISAETLTAGTLVLYFSASE